MKRRHAWAFLVAMLLPACDGPTEPSSVLGWWGAFDQPQLVYLQVTADSLVYFTELPPDGCFQRFGVAEADGNGRYIGDTRFGSEVFELRRDGATLVVYVELYDMTRTYRRVQREPELSLCG